MSAPENDSVAGFDRAPERYTTQGRETIDRMRDMAHTLTDTLPSDFRGDRAKLADVMFAYHCLVTELKYQDRAGTKGDPEGDAKKAEWYHAMAMHVLAGSPDPRADRPDFVPYSRVLL